MKKKLYIHIGCPKTATSFLQNMLDVFSGVFAKKKSTYVLTSTTQDYYKIFPKLFFRQLGSFLVLFAPLSEEAIDIIKTKVTNDIYQLDMSKVILSSEGFFNRCVLYPPGTVEGQIYMIQRLKRIYGKDYMNYPVCKILDHPSLNLQPKNYLYNILLLEAGKDSLEWVRLPTEGAKMMAKTLKSIFEPFDIHIILATRRQDYLTESFYNQTVAEGIETREWHDFLANFPLSYQYDKILDVYASEFGYDNIHTICFETIKQIGIEQFSNEFLSIIDPDLSILTKNTTHVINESLSQEGLEVMRYANKILPFDKAFKLGRYLKTLLPRDPKKRYSYFTEEIRQKILHHYAPSNIRLFEKYIKNPFFLNYYLGEEL